MFDIFILAFLGVIFIGRLVKRAFFTSYHEKCYERMEMEGYAIFGSCVGQSGGDYNTEYLSYSCVGCPYFTRTIDGKGRENELND